MKVRYVIYVLLTKKRNRFYRLYTVHEHFSWGRFFVKFASLSECRLLGRTPNFKYLQTLCNICDETD